MVTFFACSLGKVALAVVSLASLYWAHDLITAVPCLLQYIWGWYMTILVIFDHMMTPIKNELLHEHKGFLPNDSTSSPESYLGNIASECKSDGTEKCL